MNKGTNVWALIITLVIAGSIFSGIASARSDCGWVDKVVSIPYPTDQAEIVEVYGTPTLLYPISGDLGYVVKLLETQHYIKKIDLTHSPEIIDVSYPTTCINEDEYAIISVTVRNNGEASSGGYISVSFPNDEYMPESVGGTGNRYTELFPKGYYPLWNNNDEQITAVNPLVELFETNWGEGQQETISMKVKPNSGSDEIVFYVRAALKNDADGSYERDPTYSGYTDQQGWSVERHVTSQEVRFKGTVTDILAYT